MFEDALMIRVTVILAIALLVGACARKSDDVSDAIIVEVGEDGTIWLPEERIPHEAALPGSL